MTQDQVTEAKSTGSPSGDEQKPLTEREKRDPRFVQAREESGGEVGREMLAHSAMGAKLTADEEQSGLDWLLGVPRKTQHVIEVQYETPVGMKPLNVIVPRHDTKRIDEIEQRNVNPNTGRVDQLTCSCELISELGLGIEDPGTGRLVEFRSRDFLKVSQVRSDGKVEEIEVGSPAIALEKRFSDQLGLIQFAAAELRRLNGYDVERVSTAKRRLVEGALG